MRILFVAEIITYFAIFSAFFLIKESRCEKRKRNVNYVKDTTDEYQKGKTSLKE